MLANLINDVATTQPVRDVNCGSFSLTTVEISDFLAGFVAGFTGVDEQTYFEGCFHDNSSFETDICTVVNDFMTKDNQKVIEGMHLLMSDMPELNGFLAGCPNAAPEIATTENWGKYWMGQGTMKVYSTAYKNLTTNMSQVTAYINTMETDYNNNDWYGTAKEASSLAKLALPVPAAQASNGDIDCGDFTLNTTKIADFLAGFDMGFTNVNQKADWETCFKDTPQFEQDICTVIADFRTKDNQKVLEGVQALMADLPQLNTWVAACPTLTANWLVVQNWFKFWKAQGEMKVYSTAYKNIVGNMSTFQADYKDLQTKYDAGDWFGTAVDASSIAKLALPVSTAEVSLGDTDCGDFTLSPTKVADFLAGFTEGFTGVDQKADWESCFKDTPAFENDICTVVADFRTKDNQKVLEGVQALMADFPELNGWVAACPTIQTNWAVVENWFKFWKAQGEMKVYSTAYKNIVGNMSTFQADYKDLETKYDAGDWFGTAVDASGIAKLALPVSTTQANLRTADCGDFQLSTVEVADFLGGFVQGFTGNNHKAAMETCFHDNDKFETDVCTFVNDFRTKDNQKVVEGLQLLLADMPELNTFFTGCPADVLADVAVAQNWFTYWQGQGTMKVYSTAYKNVVAGMDTIKADAAKLETYYDSKDFYDAAVEASTIAKIALPVASAELLQ